MNKVILPLKAGPSGQRLAALNKSAVRWERGVSSRPLSGSVICWRKSPIHIQESVLGAFLQGPQLRSRGHLVLVTWSRPLGGGAG